MNRRVPGLVLLGVSLGALATSGLSDRAFAAAPGLSLCGFQALVGLPCPLCGGVRASAALGAGAFGEALFWNPAVALGHGALLLTGSLLVLGREPPWLESERQPMVMRSAALVLLANWIYLIIVGR